jgi:hypothetical protein
MARRIAWWAWWLGLALRVLQLWLVTHPAPDRVFMAYGIGLATFGAAIIFGISTSTAGLIIAARVPANRFGWIWIAAGVAQAVLGTLLLVAADHAASGNGPALVAGLVASAGVQTAPFLLSGLALLTFPDGRFPSRIWRRLAWMLVVVAGVRALEVVLGAPMILLLPTVTNPLAAGPLAVVVRDLDGYDAAIALLPVLVAGSAASVVARYRGADVIGRRQIRWFLAGAIVLVVTLVPFAYASIVVGPLEANSSPTFALAFLGYSVLPVATLVAITRYRLYEIDRIVNRAVLYGSLTAILAGIFTAAVALAQRTFTWLTGERSDAALVLTTLVVATLYAPLRRRLEGSVDRRFKYDRKAFGAYHDELSRLLSMLDADSAAARLAREVVGELRSTGAAVLSGTGTVTAALGAWQVDDATRIAIPGGGGPISTVIAGPRTDGAPHDPARLAEMTELAGLVARLTRVATPARR